MRKKEPSSLRARIFVIIGFFLLLFGAVFARAIKLQVMEAPALQRMAASQHTKTVSVQSKRGDIYDRNSRELAVSIEVDSVYAQPVKIESPGAAAKALAPVLSMNRAEIEKRLKTQRSFVWLKRQIDLKEDERSEVAELDGIGITKESRRYYPNRFLASNLIGFTGLDSNGLEGVELYYDNILKGGSTKLTGDRDAMGRVILFEDVNKKTPVVGMEVELTIDKTIQYIAEKSLRQAIDSSRAKGGTAIVMDPHTGEILAMASLPTFDPNDLKNSGPGSRRNKAVTDAFEPGSIFKLFLVSAGLEENVIRTTDGIYCENGAYRVADRTFHDTKKHGWLTVPQIMKYSSNIGSAKIGERLGKARLHRYVKSFGFGDKTGIDLPGEASGFFSPYGSWSDVTLHTVSFGHGVSTTGIQLITALSAVANRGFLMKPYVVKALRDPKGGVSSESHPIIARRVISEATAKKMTDMLIGVTLGDGTGVKAAIDGFEVAGKTGTAQKPDLKNGGYMKDAYIASFMGFVPAKDPRLAILVTVDEPKDDYYGGSVAAPAFKEIASQSLSYLGVFPRGQKSPSVRAAGAGNIAPFDMGDDDVEKSTEWDSRYPSVPDFSGKTVRSVLNMARNKSINVEIIGGGKAIGQRPQPGRNIPANGHVVVWFQ